LELFTNTNFNATEGSITKAELLLTETPQQTITRLVQIKRDSISGSDRALFDACVVSIILNLGSSKSGEIRDLKWLLYHLPVPADPTTKQRFISTIQQTISSHPALVNVGVELWRINDDVDVEGINRVLVDAKNRVKESLALSKTRLQEMLDHNEKLAPTPQKQYPILTIIFAGLMVIGSGVTAYLNWENISTQNPPTSLTVPDNKKISHATQSQSEPQLQLSNDTQQ